MAVAVEKMSYNILNLASAKDGNGLNIVTKDKNHVVGREILPVLPLKGWRPSEEIARVLNTLNRPTKESADLRDFVVFKLNNNTAYWNSALGFERPVSAYFTYNPVDETVIIEWGIIDPKTGEAKLHSLLNQVIDAKEREKQGMQLSSGHLAKFHSKDTEAIYLAFIDRLYYDNCNNQNLNRESPLGKMINTLYGHNILPITGDGYLQLPSF